MSPGHRHTSVHTADGTRLAVEERGDGLPVVLVHGLTATRHYVVMGSRVLERSGHRVIGYDARGHGASSPAGEAKEAEEAEEAGAYGYVNLTEDLVAVLDALGVTRAVLAGASMGAHTILRAALEHPERVGGLVVITPAHDPGRAAGRERLKRWDALAAGLRAGGVEGFVAAYGEPRVPERWRESLLTVLRQRMGRHEHPLAVADALQAVPRSSPFESLAALGALDIPTVVVASRDEADPEHPYAVAEAYARAIPGAWLVSEQPGESPLAWQGGRLSKGIAELAARSAREGRMP